MIWIAEALVIIAMAFVVLVTAIKLIEMFKGE
jgi:hypothetical protein